jgi:hypothetical protein
MSDDTETNVETGGNDPVNLIELLNKPMSDFPDLPNLPGQKWFYGKLTGVAASHSRQKQTPLYDFGIRITDPGKDVTTADLAVITSKGFSLADYEAHALFYVTPNAMKMLRRFLTSLGFAESVSFVEALGLDQNGNPTAATQEKIRGRDVIFRTPAADDQKRVFLSNVDMISGNIDQK